MKTGFAVIGMGRFGRSVVRTLTRLGVPVMAIDSNQRAVQEMSADVEAAVCIDTTDSEQLAEVNIEGFSGVIVGIGEASIESSILTTALLSQLGVPRIIARAAHELHGRVLRSVGAHEVVNPEAEIGKRMASRLAQPGLLEQVSLGENAILAEIEAPASLSDQTLAKLNMRNRYDVSVVAIRRPDSVVANPKSDETLQTGDVLVIIGAEAAVRRLGNLT